MPKLDSYNGLLLKAFSVAVHFEIAGLLFILIFMKRKIGILVPQGQG
jgi:hypothetical protein